MSDKKTELAKEAPKQLSQSERFTLAVTKEASQLGELKLTDFQKKLCQNYFIRLDQQLKDLEVKRLATDERYRSKIEFDWKNVNMTGLSLGVIACASMELDASLPNHINMIPFANKHTGKYDIGFIKGYRGMEIVAKKYALDAPEKIVVELVYETDVFNLIKKDMGNPVENYSFAIKNPFERGKIIGGFYAHIFADATKNRVVAMSIADIEKRKPKKAAAEFWGGEKDVYAYKNGKSEKIGEKEIVEGYYKEMCYKTVYRACCNDITLDSSKINANFLLMSKIEKEAVDLSVKEEIAENANQTTVDISHEEVASEPTKLQPVKEEKKKEVTATDPHEGQETISF
jgi:recombination protein RecT